MKILLIEDNPDDIEQIARALSQLSETYTLSTAKSAREAFSLLDQTGTSAFDVVLTDRHLPGMLGTKLSDRLRKHKKTKTAAFIMVTGDVGDKARSEALVYDLDGFLTKPVDGKRLSKMLLNGQVFWELSDLPHDLEMYRSAMADS